MPDAEQTVDGNYEVLEKHTFEAVDYKRYMSWRKGKGFVTLGERTEEENRVRRKLEADTDEENHDVYPGWYVTVENVEFKLVKTITW